MVNDADKRARLVENRQAIADKANQLADASDKKFLIDAGFIGGLGTAITTIFAQYGGSPAGSTILGASSASLITLSHITGTFNKDLYIKMSSKAHKEAFDFTHGKSIEGAEPMLFQDYEERFKAGHTASLSSLKTIRSVAIAGGFTAMLAFALTQEPESDARKEEELEETINQDSYSVLVHQM